MAQKMRNTPQPCPWCGCKVTGWQHATDDAAKEVLSVTCCNDECGACGPNRATKRQAIAAWNGGPLHAPLALRASALCKTARDEDEDSPVLQRAWRGFYRVVQTMEVQRGERRRLAASVAAWPVDGARR